MKLSEVLSKNGSNQAEVVKIPYSVHAFGAPIAYFTKDRDARIHAAYHFRTAQAAYGLKVSEYYFISLSGDPESIQVDIIPPDKMSHMEQEVLTRPVRALTYIDLYNMGVEPK